MTREELENTLSQYIYNYGTQRELYRQRENEDPGDGSALSLRELKIDQAYNRLITKIMAVLNESK